MAQVGIAAAASSETPGDVSQLFFHRLWLTLGFGLSRRSQPHIRNDLQQQDVMVLTQSTGRQRPTLS